MHARSILPALLLTLVACSSEGNPSAPPPGCNVDPWQCPAGQTCWPTDLAGHFACLNSANGKKKGDACGNTVGAPTCGDALACLQLAGSSGGTCLPYCDPAKPAHGCAAGETCQQIVLSGTTASFYVCVGPAPEDAGTDTGTDTGTETSTDSGTDSGSDTSVTDAADSSADGG